jgi:protein ImuB
MSCVCLWSPAWSTGAAPLVELAAALLEVAPRIAVEERGVLWADATGLDGERLARALLTRCVPHGEARAGVARVPVAAELAARTGGGGVTAVAPGEERCFLAPLPLALLEPDTRLRALLEGVGIRHCGGLAELSREAVEVRFGVAGTALWRLARADDPRRLFAPAAAEPPHASLDFVDYAVADAERLLFPLNALLGRVCGELRARGERARSIKIELPLSGGGTHVETLRGALPTAEHAPWLRRVRDRLERLTLPDSVTGVALRSAGVLPASATQGDLFDRGFATAGATEEAAARIIDIHGALFVIPYLHRHPLPERRTEWIGREAADIARPERISASEPCLTLQLLPHPRRLAVRAAPGERGLLPTHYRDGGGWTRIARCAGPDRISGGHWEERPYAREYFRCVAETGELLWIFWDVIQEQWFLHGWWD